MRSGIGPEPHLRELDVDVSVNLPGVGQNLQDHAAATVVYRSARPIPPAANNHGEVLGLLRSTPALAAPDLQILFIDVPLTVPSLPGPDQGYALLVSLMAPHSRGSVRLRSADPRSDDTLRSYLRRALQTYHHPVGTCRIGEDDTAVLDTELRVHGISGLRVADASVMPTIVSGNTMASVYAIAEKAASLIREYRPTPLIGTVGAGSVSS
jgi:choline dehydrogenase